MCMHAGFYAGDVVYNPPNKMFLLVVGVDMAAADSTNSLTMRPLDWKKPGMPIFVVRAY